MFVSTDLVLITPYSVCSLTRNDSEKILARPGTTDGSYILRHSQSSTHTYTLDVRVMDSVLHYRISTNQAGRVYIEGGRTFPSLEALIEYYHRNSLGSVPCKLTTCCSEVSKATLKFESILYDGNRHKVWHGVWNNNPVTIKVATKMTMPQYSLQEIKTMKLLRHPNIVELYAVCTLSDPITLVLEHLRNAVRLSDYLQKLKKQPSLKFIIQVASQVASAMEYLAKLNIAHCHLKSSSIQLVGQQRVKVTNFYHSRVLQDGTARAVQGIWRWSAPGVLRTGLVTKKSDVWSFGVLLHQMFTCGKQLYEEINPEDILSRLQDGYRLPCPSGCEKAWYELMLDCWRLDHDKRPEFSHLFVRIQILQMLGE